MIKSHVCVLFCYGTNHPKAEQLKSKHTFIISKFLTWNLSHVWLESLVYNFLEDCKQVLGRESVLFSQCLPREAFPSKLTM